MCFDDVRFPTAIARGAVGGPERRTDIVTTASGREERNGRWAESRRRYNAGFGLASLNDIEAVVAFFEERRGRLHAFRFKDHADFKSCVPLATPAATDQVIGTGDGATRAFQLVKRYGTAGLRSIPYGMTEIRARKGVLGPLLTGNKADRFRKIHGLLQRSRISIAAITCGAHGLMLEVHPEPAKALSDGPQSLDFDTFEQLMQRLAIGRRFL